MQCCRKRLYLFNIVSSGGFSVASTIGLTGSVLAAAVLSHSDVMVDLSRRPIKQLGDRLSLTTEAA